jgi:hypothetical protein
MASDEAWKKLENMFGTADVAYASDIYMPPEEPMDDEARAILRRMNDGEELTRAEVLQLPSKYHELYYLTREGLEEKEILRQKRIKAKEEKFRKLFAKEQLIYERTLRKIQARVDLTPEEIAIHQKFSSRAYQLGGPDVKVNLFDILNDVAKGDYTLQDVNLAKGGTEVRPVETSPMQLLENIVEDSKKKTQNALHANDTAQFFQTVESDAFSRITPMQMDNLISSCTTGL